MKNKIKNVLAASALGLVLTFGYQAKAQNKISIETSLVDNKNGSGVPLQRLVAETKPITLKYDLNSGLGNGANPEDIGAIFFNNIYSKNNTTVGAYIMNSGNFDGKDELWPGAWIKKNFGDITATLEAGKSARKTGPSREYAILYFRSPDFSGDIAYFAQGSTFSRNEFRKYGWGAYHDKFTYIGAGKENARDLGFLGISGFEDFGTFTFARYDESTDNLWIKSQTSYGNVNKSFYNSGLFDVAANYFTLPAFFTKHFSPLSAKGDLSLKLEYKRTKGVDETEVMVATNKTPIQIGVGINTDHDASISGLVFELYKDFSVAGIKGDVEVRYNARTEDLSAYLKANYEF